MFPYESSNCEAGDEIHLYEVSTTNLLFVRRAKRSTDLSQIYRDFHCMMS